MGDSETSRVRGSALVGRWRVLVLASVVIACGSSGGGAKDDNAAGNGPAGAAGESGTDGSSGSAGEGAGGAAQAGAEQGGHAESAGSGSAGEGDGGEAGGDGGEAGSGSPSGGDGGEAGSGSSSGGNGGTAGEPEGGAAGNSEGQGGTAGAGDAGEGGAATAGAGGSGGGEDTAGAGGSIPLEPTWTPNPEACPDIGLDPALGTVHYVCDCGEDAAPDCEPGDDENDGLTPEAAWQSYDKALTEFGSLAAGDSIAFCRGGVFVAGELNRWINTNCTADERCVVRDYPPSWGSGDEAAPTIDSPSGRAFSLENSGVPVHEEGYVFMNLSLRGGGSYDGFFVHNDTDDVLICNVTIDGFANGVYVAGSNEGEAGADTENERIVLESSIIRNNRSSGWVGGCSGCAVQNNYFVDNGSGTSALTHNVVVTSPAGATVSDMRVVGNELYHSAIVDGACSGTSLIARGYHEGLLIEGNLIREDVGHASGQCWGIALDPGITVAEGFVDATIRDNVVINVGNTGIALSSCDSCTVENNVVVLERPMGLVAAIRAPARPHGEDDLPMAALRVRNNTIVVAGNQGGTGISLGVEGSDHVVVSNAIRYQGSSGAWNCFDLPLDASAYADVDYNLCFFPNSDGAWSSTAGSLEDWNADTGFDAHSLDVDPEFADATSPAWDVAPASGASPLVDAGHPSLSAATAQGGEDRDGAPDIGAAER